MARQHLKALSGGVIALCVILLLTPATYSQGVRGRRKTFVISGNVGMPEVTMQGLPGAPKTDENGVYSVEVTYGWKGTVIPVKRGYTFTPNEKIYEPVRENMTTEDYLGDILKFKISGSVGLPGVMMQGLPDSPVTDAAGRYSVTVPYGFTDTVIPFLEGYQFEPPTKSYSLVIADQAQDYKARKLTYVISGTVGADGVTMKGLPGNPVTSGGGRYRVEVDHGWEGTVTPTKEGHEFSPPERPYMAITSPQTNQDYISSVYTFQITGTVSMPGVTLQGFPNDPISDSMGVYTAIVEYGWDGKVTPFLAGYAFSPKTQNYTDVKSNLENQNFNAELIQLTISGTVGTDGVTLNGLPGNPEADRGGFFTAKVEYGWDGMITPTKEGWSFEPSNQVISSVANDKLNMNFKASRITYTISGNVGLKGVTLNGFPTRVVSGADGSYSGQVPYKFTGSITPKMAGYEFSPPSYDYVDMLSSHPSEIFMYKIVQHSISGRILADKTAQPVAGVLIQAGLDGGSTTTDVDGEYELFVDHGWGGTITPIKEGFTFSPVKRAIQPVFGTTSHVGFLGKVKMLTITDAIIFEDGPMSEPIQDVIITAIPGGSKVVTDAKGKYTISVPYGWSGELTFEKEGFDFDPPSASFAGVTENIDKTAPPVTAPPVTPPADTPPPVTQPDDTPPPVTQPADTQLPLPERDPAKEALQAEIDALKELLAGKSVLPPLPNERTGQGVGITKPFLNPPAITSPGPSPTLLGPVGGNASVLNLLDVLAWLQEKTGVKIAVDATVKKDPVSIAFDLNAVTPATIPAALQLILEPTGYMFKSAGDNTFLVFKPISNQFIGDDLRNVLQDIGYAAGVTIVPDANVAGDIYAALTDVSLDTALKTVLAGTPFAVKKTPNFYLVADRTVLSDAFVEISETHHVRLNYLKPMYVMEHISPAFEQYVRADADPNGRTITVVAVPSIAKRIVDDIKRLDIRPRHVILEARVVVMERSDLLDLGAEWGWPQISAGTFSNTAGTIWGTQMGYTPDSTFTNSLLLALNLLQENDQAEIVTKPVVTAQDGTMSDLSVMTEEYYMLQPQINNSSYVSTEMVTIESGTKIQITPHIGDNDDITLEIATEVSESIPAAAVTALPVVTRRQSRSITTVKDGGTVALAGLTETRSTLKEKKVPGLSDLPFIGGIFQNTTTDQSTKELAVFITASIVHESAGELTQSQGQTESQPEASVARPVLSDDFRRRLEDRLADSR